MPEPLDYWSAGQLLRAFRAKTAVTGGGRPVRARPDRDAERRGERVLPPGSRGRARGRAVQRGPLGPRRAEGPPRRGPGVRQGRPPHPRHGDASGLAHGERRSAVARRRSGGRAPARARGGDPREDHHPGARPQVRHGQPAHRHHAEPVEPRAQPRREQRRRGGRVGRRTGPARRGHRRRRLDPDPGDVERHRRPQADRRPRPDLAAVPLGRALARGPHGPVRGRRRAPPHRAGPSRPARSGRPAGRRPGLPGRARGRRGRPSHRLQPRPGAGRGGAGHRGRRGGRGPDARSGSGPA